MILRQRSISRDHDCIISLLSSAMNEEQNKYDDYIDNINVNDDEFDELPVNRTTFTRGRSRTASKLDFCLIQDHMIRCVCANIIAHIQKCENDCYIPPDEYKIFNKESGSLDYSLDSVSFVFTTVHKETQMEFECIVVALIYLERIPRLTNKKLRICAHNWRYLLFICMMLSSKIWDDFSMINADYSAIFSNLPLEKINLLEISILKIFNFSVEITTQEYYKMQKTLNDLNIAANQLRLNTKVLKSGQGTLIPSSSTSSTTKFSISGRLSLQSSNINNDKNNINIDEEDSFHLRENNYDSPTSDNENLLSCSYHQPQNTLDTLEEMTNSLNQDIFDGYDEEKRNYSNSNIILPYHTKSLSQSLNDNNYIESSNSFNDLNSNSPQKNNNNNSNNNFDNNGDELGERNDLYPEVKDHCDNSVHPKGIPRRKTSIQLAVDNALLVLVKYLPIQTTTTQSAKIHVTNEIV